MAGNTTTLLGFDKLVCVHPKQTAFWDTFERFMKCCDRELLVIIGAAHKQILLFWMQVVMGGILACILCSTEFSNEILYGHFIYRYFNLY